MAMGPDLYQFRPHVPQLGATALHLDHVRGLVLPRTLVLQLHETNALVRNGKEQFDQLICR